MSSVHRMLIPWSDLPESMINFLGQSKLVIMSATVKTSCELSAAVLEFVVVLDTSVTLLHFGSVLQNR